MEQPAPERQWTEHEKVCIVVQRDFSRLLQAELS